MSARSFPQGEIESDHTAQPGSVLGSTESIMNAIQPRNTRRIRVERNGAGKQPVEMTYSNRVVRTVTGFRLTVSSRSFLPISSSKNECSDTLPHREICTRPLV